MINIVVKDSGPSPIYQVGDEDTVLTPGAGQKVVTVEDPNQPSVYCYWDGAVLIKRPFPGSVYEEELINEALFEKGKYEIVPNITLLNTVIKAKWSTDARDRVDLITGQNKWQKLRDFLNWLLEDQEIGKL